MTPFETHAPDSFNGQEHTIVSASKASPDILYTVPTRRRAGFPNLYLYGFLLSQEGGVETRAYIGVRRSAAAGANWVVSASPSLAVGAGLAIEVTIELFPGDEIVAYSDITLSATATIEGTKGR